MRSCTSHQGIYSSLCKLQQKLADFSDPNLAEYFAKEVPFSSLPSDAPPAVRPEYITLDPIIRFSATPDCKACTEMKGRHNSRCKARFDSLVKAEKYSRTDKSPSIPADGHAPVEDKTEHVPVDATVDEAVPAEHPDDLLFSAGIRPGDPEAAMINKIASTIDESFAQASVTRAKFRRMNTLSGFGTIFEFACSQDSVIGQQAEAIRVNCVRLCRSTLDLCNPDHVRQAIGPLEAQPGADAWASVTCTHHSPIQNLILHMHGQLYAKKLQKTHAES